MRREPERDAHDRAAMARLCDGDHSGFEELWARYREPIFAFLLRRTGSRASAEDALQQCFVRVYRYRDSFATDGSFRRWLYGIAANAGRDAWRAEPAMWDPLPETLTGGLDPAKRAEARSQIARVLHGLRGSERRVLLLTIEGFSSPEIAQMLGMNENTVRVQLMRARERLQAKMEVFGEG